MYTFFLSFPFELTKNKKKNTINFNDKITIIRIYQRKNHDIVSTVHSYDHVYYDAYSEYEFTNQNYLS